MIKLPEDFVIIDNTDISNTFGIYPDDRQINDYIDYGIILLDKPAGPTSHEVVAIVKKILSLKRAGHSGTLDPNVTGVLPIALSNSTKILASLLKSNKKYICKMINAKTFSLDLWNSKFQEYEREIYQMPPLKSNVVKKLRKRTIFQLKLIEMDANDNILFEVTSEAGTYIRTLCIDLGRSIGSSSFMGELRRIQSGPFIENELKSLHQLFDAWSIYQENKNEIVLREIIQPIEILIQFNATVMIKTMYVNLVCHGVNILKKSIMGTTEFNENSLICLISSKHELIGIGNALINSSEIEKMNDDSIVIKPYKIIMNRDLYPRF